MAWWGRDRRREMAGPAVVKKDDDRSDLDYPNYPPCHPRNGGHDVQEIARTTNAEGRISVIGRCTKCDIETSELLEA